MRAEEHRFLHWPPIQSCPCHLRRYDTAMLKIISLLVLLLISGNAHAEQIAEQVIAQNTLPSISNARALIEQGQDNDAISMLGQLLKNSSEDFQAWFLLGVTQAKQRRFHDAVVSFGKVVSLQPKLAEPHNNLAVIYNELGDFRAAVKELEASLKLKPDYATAHENIGDLYVKLAADAYRKALVADGRPALRQRYDRLLHIRDAHAPAHKPDTAVDKQAGQTATSDMVQHAAVEQDGLLPEAAAASKAKASDAPEQPGPDQHIADGNPGKPSSAQKLSTAQAVVLATENKPVAKPAASENRRPIQPLPAATTQPEAALERPVLHGDNKDHIAEKAGAPTGAVKSPTAQDDIKSAMAAVEAWRSAWNRQDVPAYFAAYSDAFDFGARFETLEQWKQYKQWVITKRTFIRVTLENIVARKLANGEIRLVFLQHFRSDSFNSDDIKKMLLRQTQDGWKIIYEASR